ncbi:MAG: DNA repair protein RecO [Candidatus Taylorbacteria bacterium]|nr:DNA repair protein RecO [Candidatus Taylorbacteria bacterium]
MYSIHTTPGFVIDSQPYSEAGKILSLFTRDFGLVKAVAQGIRLEKSKLRYFTQDYSMGVYSLVRGKEFWRLTSTQDNNNGGQGLAKSEIAVRIGLLLKRFLNGEEPHHELFNCVESLTAFLANNQGLTTEELRTFESLGVFMILKNMGYVGDDADLASVMGSENPSDINRTLLAKISKKRTIINQHINKALKESHL